MAEKIYYSMGEVAEMLDVSQSLLRFWEQKFDIITPHKNKKGNRMFSPEDVRNLKTIYHLVKERGMTLAGAAKYLKANKKAIERDMEIAERLAAVRALLVEVREELGGEGRIVDNEPEITNYDAATGPAAADAPIKADEPSATDEPVAAEEEPATTDAFPAEPPKPQYIEQTLF